MRSMRRKKVKSEPPKTNGETSSRARYRSRTGNLTRLLYHSRVRWPAGCGTWTRAVGALLLLAWALGPRALGAAGVPDRLARFRELALSRQRVVQLDRASARQRSRRSGTP